MPFHPPQNFFKRLPRWQRSICYAAFGLALGLAVTKKMPETVDNMGLLLIAIVGPPIAYQAGANFALNHPPSIEDHNDA